MRKQKIRVGIIGVGGWAKYGHLPALETLDQLEVVAVSSRSLEKAEQLAAEHGIAHAFDDYQQLVAHPDVDLVVVPTPAPNHAPLVKAAIAAGKDVYSEWPLTTNTADSEELLTFAEAAGVRHVVGLQRRFAPSARYTIDHINQGHIGEIRGVTMSVGVDAFGAELLSRYPLGARPSLLRQPAAGLPRRLRRPALRHRCCSMWSARLRVGPADRAVRVNGDG